MSDHQLLVSETPLLQQAMRRDDRKEKPLKHELYGVIVEQFGDDGDEPVYRINLRGHAIPNLYISAMEAEAMVNLFARYGVHGRVSFDER